MYLDAKQKVARAAKTEEENKRLKQRISQLDEKAIAHEKSKTASAEQKAKEQTIRADREEQRANDAESSLSKMERFIHQAADKAFHQWTILSEMVDKAVNALNAWAHKSTSIFSDDEERVIGQSIIAQCQIEGLNPEIEADRKSAVNSIAKVAEATVGADTQFRWDISVTRIGQLAHEMSISMRGQSVGGSNGRSATKGDACQSKNADELTNWDGTKKRGLGI